MNQINKSILLIALACFLIVNKVQAETTTDLFDVLVTEKMKNKNLITRSRKHNCSKKARCENLPRLDGIWKLKKETVKRFDPYLIKPVTFIHCNSRFPTEIYDFEKEVVINEGEFPYFNLRTKYPVTYHDYYDATKNKDIEYGNFGFKAAIDPEDITFAYTLKRTDYLNDREHARQVWFNGKVYYESISANRIEARGYEIIHSPECEGYLRDEVRIVLVRRGPVPPEGPGIGTKEVPTLPPLISAKDKSDFEPNPEYEPFDSIKDILKPGGPNPMNVPGLW